jgi:hypothetical protein
MDLVQALLADALDLSSERWSKASETATVGLDQVRALDFLCRFSLSRLHQCHAKPLEHPGIWLSANRPEFSRPGPGANRESSGRDLRGLLRCSFTQMLAVFFISSALVARTVLR